MSSAPRHFSRFYGAHRAFTLLELLMVMCIISILVAILLPVMNLVRSRMDSAQCLSQLRQIGTAMGAYMNDHEGFFPGPLSFEQTATYKPGQPGSLAALLESYLGTANSVAPDGASRYSPVFVCPAAARKLKGPTQPSYIVSFLQSPETNQCVWGDVTQNQSPLRNTALVNWSDATSGGAPLSLPETWALQDGDQNYVAQVSMYSGPVNDLLPNQAHGDHWNDLFFDFHAASRSALITISDPAKPPATPGAGPSH